MSVCMSVVRYVQVYNGPKSQVYVYIYMLQFAAYGQFILVYLAIRQPLEQLDRDRDLDFHSKNI